MIQFKVNNLLKLSALLWFLVTAASLWLFSYYLFEYYLLKALKHGLSIWAETRLPNGYIQEDVIGNIAVAIHLFVGFYISLFGPLQLIPYIRKNFPGFHRINGRAFLITAMLTSVAGLYMVWIRGDDVGNTMQQISISFSGILIFLFGFLAWNAAVHRKFKSHSLWAMRLFIVANAAWFLRVGYQFWNFIAMGGIGHDSQVFFSQFFTLWTFGSYLIPLVILEFYFFAASSHSKPTKIYASITIIIFTAVLALGSYNAFFGMWLPRLT